ncbi:hypothetical protein HMP0721_0856 [Pseudoramibacter alactolyticus ATCC 23263]|uniref:Uncharacterized protein n=1 Tax=Pseudoramibacter alactolyticus ATCC 23263 TaxID=887929 RepID=E6MFU5_9FIRM|nr:hypothetical protein HMP0721_0856 [Pseudoramibacter alactolyticus ATCC 23263]
MSMAIAVLLFVLGIRFKIEWSDCYRPDLKPEKPCVIINSRNYGLSGLMQSYEIIRINGG